MYDDTITDTCKITVIATGLDDATAREASVSASKKAVEDKKKNAFANAGFTMPAFTMPTATAAPAPVQTPTPMATPTTPVSNIPKKEIFRFQFP